MLKNKALFAIFLLLIGTLVGYWFFNLQNPSFENLNSEEMYRQIIEERDYAINKAVAAGDYKCCIEPPCTMCYMEANQWNNFKERTCACDDLIAQGKEPCPQCKSGLCQIDGDLSGSCNSQEEEN